MKTETKYRLAIVVILGSFLLAAERVLAAPPPGGGGEPEVDPGVSVVVDVIAEGGDATADSYAEGGDAAADSYSEGSESYSEGSSADSYSEGSDSSAYSEGSVSEGGTAESSATGGSGGAGGQSASEQGQSQSATSSVRVGGNNSSFRYNYQEAAKTAAALTTAVCQDGTSLQGVKFGLSKVNQSVFCMYTVTAQLSLGLSASMVCEDGPNYPLCAARKADLFRQGMVLIKRAIDIADEKRHRGLFKKLFRKVW